MTSSRATRCFVLPFAVVGFAFLLSGCGSVSVYSDSVIAPNGTMPVHTYGQEVVAEISSYFKVTDFRSEPGKTQTTHVLNGMLRSVPAGGFPGSPAGAVDVVVVALGTNDPTDFVYGNPTGHNVQGAVDQADFVLRRAAESRVRCVVWVLPAEVNRYLFDAAQQAAAKDYVHIFNGYLLGLPRVLDFDGHLVAFRAVDWGSIAANDEHLSGDGAHPNAFGAVVLGRMIRDAAAECSRPDALPGI
ncbi:MAG: hypothetical protein WBD02_05670 [Acidimicrobiia bacterium]